MFLRLFNKKLPLKIAYLLLSIGVFGINDGQAVDLDCREKTEGACLLMMHQVQATEQNLKIMEYWPKKGLALTQENLNLVHDVVCQIRSFKDIFSQYDVDNGIMLINNGLAVTQENLRSIIYCIFLRFELTQANLNLVQDIITQASRFRGYFVSGDDVDKGIMLINNGLAITQQNFEALLYWPIKGLAITQENLNLLQDVIGQARRFRGDYVSQDDVDKGIMLINKGLAITQQNFEILEHWPKKGLALTQENLNLVHDIVCQIRSFKDNFSQYDVEYGTILANNGLAVSQGNLESITYCRFLRFELTQANLNLIQDIIGQIRRFRGNHVPSLEDVKKGIMLAANGIAINQKNFGVLGYYKNSGLSLTQVNLDRIDDVLTKIYAFGCFDDVSLDLLMKGLGLSNQGLEITRKNLRFSQ